MSQKSYRPLSLISAVAMFAFLTSCTSSGAADPTSETTSSAESALTSASQSPTVTSGAAVTLPTDEPSVTTQTFEVTEPTTETPPTTNPWPDTLTPEQAADAQAAVDALMGYSALIDAAFADPGRDWSEEIKKWAGDPARTEFVNAIQGTAELGQYGTGTVGVFPTVTNVEGAVADITVCFDSTNVGFFDKNGSSIKAPDVPGSYLRHPAQVEVARYASGAWLVTTVIDDYSKTC